MPSLKRSEFFKAVVWPIPSPETARTTIPSTGSNPPKGAGRARGLERLPNPFRSLVRPTKTKTAREDTGANGPSAPDEPAVSGKSTSSRSGKRARRQKKSKKEELPDCASSPPQKEFGTRTTITALQGTRTEPPRWTRLLPVKKPKM